MKENENETALIIAEETGMTKPTSKDFRAAVRADLFTADLATTKVIGKEEALKAIQSSVTANAAYWNLLAAAVRADAQEKENGNKTTVQDEFFGLCNAQAFLDELGMDKVNATIATGPNAPEGLQMTYRAALILNKAKDTGAVVDDDFFLNYAKGSRYNALEALRKCTDAIVSRNKAEKADKTGNTYDYGQKTVSQILTGIELAFNNWTDANKADDIATTPGFLPLPAAGSEAEKVAEAKAKAKAEKEAKKQAEKAKAEKPLDVHAEEVKAGIGQHERDREHEPGTLDEDRVNALYNAIKFQAPPCPEQEQKTLVSALREAFDAFLGQSVTAYDILRTACRCADTHTPETLIGTQEAKTNAEILLKDAALIAEETIADAERKAANIIDTAKHSTTPKRAKHSTTKTKNTN